MTHDEFMKTAPKIPDGEYNLMIRRQVQNRHIAGTVEHLMYGEKLSEKILKPSVLAENVVAAELIREFHKKGIYFSIKKYPAIFCEVHKTGE